LLTGADESLRAWVGEGLSAGWITQPLNALCLQPAARTA
jgi:hypothetical protein